MLCLLPPPAIPAWCLGFWMVRLGGGRQQVGGGELAGLLDWVVKGAAASSWEAELCLARWRAILGLAICWPP